MAKKNNKKELPDLSEVIASMYDKRVFDVQSLRRKFFPYFQINEVLGGFSMKRRTTLNFIRCTHYRFENQTVVNVVYTTQHKETYKFEFFVSSNKEFMQKLEKHNLIPKLYVIGQPFYSGVAKFRA